MLFKSKIHHQKVKIYFPQQLLFDPLQHEFPPLPFPLPLQQLLSELLQHGEMKIGNGLQTGTLIGIGTILTGVQHCDAHWSLHGGAWHGEHWQPPQPPPNWAGSTWTSTKPRSSSANANWTKRSATKITENIKSNNFYSESENKFLTFHRVSVKITAEKNWLPRCFILAKNLSQNLQQKYEEKDRSKMR